MTLKDYTMVYLLTTSHKPSRRLRSFLKDLASILPGAVKVNRGKKRLEDLLYDALELKAKRLIVLREYKGNPAGIDVYKIDFENEMLRPLISFHIRGVRLSRETVEAVRIYNPRVFAVYAGQATHKLEEEFIDMFVKAFDVKMYLGEINEIAGKVDVLAIPKWDSREKVIKVFFINPSTKRLGGPLIKFTRVIDHETNRSIP